MQVHLSASRPHVNSSWLIEGATGNRPDKAAGAIVLMSTKSYVHAESFEKDAGFRFSRDGISILVRGMIPGRRLSAAENIALSSGLDRYFDEILGHPARNAGAQDVPLTRSDFVQPDKGPLFKFVCDTMLSTAMFTVTLRSLQSLSDSKSSSAQAI